MDCDLAFWIRGSTVWYIWSYLKISHRAYQDATHDVEYDFSQRIFMMMIVMMMMMTMMTRMMMTMTMQC